MSAQAVLDSPDGGAMNLSSARILSLILAILLSCFSLNWKSSSSYLIVLNEIFKNPETLWPLTHYWALLVTGIGVSSLWLVWFTVFSHGTHRGAGGLVKAALRAITLMRDRVLLASYRWSGTTVVGAGILSTLHEPVADEEQRRHAHVRRRLRGGMRPVGRGDADNTGDGREVPQNPKAQPPAGPTDARNPRVREEARTVASSPDTREAVR